MGFERELRYYVAKRKDVDSYLSPTEHRILNLLLNKVAVGRFNDKKPVLRSVVVESDWPEYEPVWSMIQKRIQNKQSLTTVVPDIARCLVHGL